METHIKEVEDALGQHFLIENPSSYVGFRASTMSEPDFLSELVSRSDCRLLCDISNVVVSAHNMGYDAREYISRPPDSGCQSIASGWLYSGAR